MIQKIIIVLLFQVSLFSQCEVTDIRIERVGTMSTKVHGLANCNKGQVLIKLYDKDKNEYLDHHLSVIRDGVFQAFFFKQPNNIEIKYTSKKW